MFILSPHVKKSFVTALLYLPAMKILERERETERQRERGEVEAIGSRI